MIKRTLSFIACLVIHSFLISVLARAQTAGAPSGQAESAFNKLVDEYFDFYFQCEPNGSHPGRLPSVRRATGRLLASRSGSRDRWTGKVPETVRCNSESRTARGIGGRPRCSDLHHSCTSAGTANDSDVEKRSRSSTYRTLSYSVFLIMRRNFAPQAERLRSVIARENEDSTGPGSGPAEPQQSSPGLYRSRAASNCRTTSSSFNRMFRKAFREVKDASVAGRVQGKQRRSDRGSEQLSELSSEGVVAGIQRRFPPGRGEFQQEAALRRDGGYSARSPARGWLCGSSAQPASS